MEELATFLLSNTLVIPELGKWSQVDPWGFSNSQPSLVRDPISLVSNKATGTWGITAEADLWPLHTSTQAHTHPKRMCIHTHVNIHTKQISLRPSEGREEGRRVVGIEEGAGEKEGDEKGLSKS